MAGHFLLSQSKFSLQNKAQLVIIAHDVYPIELVASIVQENGDPILHCLGKSTLGSRGVNDTLILASYSGSVRKKTRIRLDHCRAELEIEQLELSSEPSSSIPILGSSRLANLTSFLF